MAKNLSNKFDSFQLLSPILLIGYLSLGFVPNLQAVDKIAPQWVGMTLLNLLSLTVFMYFRKYIKQTISKVLNLYLSLFYIGFILWAGLSYFYAINSTEVLVNITRQVNVLFMFLSMGILLFNLKNKARFISWSLSIILSIEIYSVLAEALEMINTTGVISSGSLKGVTANRNITAFSIAIKIPFVLYLIGILRKSSLKLLLTTIIFLALLSLSMIQSRASFIAVGLLTIGYSIWQIIIYLKHTKSTKSLLSIGYIIIPLLLAISINQTVIASKGADALSRAATISLSTNDGSVNQRLRYYQDVLTHLTSNPIIGTGLGNWKLKSIDYDSKDINGYVVPYHAHSDFIQLGAELGIIGFLLYLGVFLCAVYYVFIFIRHSKSSVEEKTFVFLLLVALGVYSVDANLNFPIARPQVLVVWAAIMALIVTFYQKHKGANEPLKTKPILTPIFLTLALICLLPSLVVTNKVYESLKGQMFLLQDFNSNQYNVPLNQVDTIVPDIPNITVTTIPINSVKARYYVNAKQYDKALALLDNGTKANPYLYYSEILKSQIFQEKGQIDSAMVYAKKAFFGLPNNDLHASRYINLINLTRDKEALEEAFPLLTAKNKLNNWKNYLIVGIGLYPPNDKSLSEKAKKAIEIFPNNQQLIELYRQIVVGIDGVNRAVTFSQKGLEYFNNQDYVSAAEQFESAMGANPLDYAHFENAATANYLIGNLEKAEEQIDVVINDLNPLNGKCEYIKALIYIKMGDPIGACPLLATSRDSGYSQASATFDQYCR
ncbi:O-antigen ligase family protein [Flavobacteriaceae bacterium]|nr:O-antigen ligase family protein [Flavobacteriaceae bacterium]